LKKNHKLSQAVQFYTAKLAPKYIGPFKIITVVSPVVYDVADMDGNNPARLHITELKAFRSPGTSFPLGIPPSQPDSEEYRKAVLEMKERKRLWEEEKRKAVLEEDRKREEEERQMKEIEEARKKRQEKAKIQEETKKAEPAEPKPTPVVLPTLKPLPTPLFKPLIPSPKTPTPNKPLIELMCVDEEAKEQPPVEPPTLMDAGEEDLIIYDPFVPTPTPSPSPHLDTSHIPSLLELDLAMPVLEAEMKTETAPDQTPHNSAPCVLDREAQLRVIKTMEEAIRLEFQRLQKKEEKKNEKKLPSLMDLKIP
ncbi:hypothetical protein PV328_012268, partial [Microctonus aethiopoides]